MDSDEEICERCVGSGAIMASTNHLGPDDYDIEVECPSCGGCGVVKKFQTGLNTSL